MLLAWRSRPVTMTNTSFLADECRRLRLRLSVDVTQASHDEPAGPEAAALENLQPS